MESCRYLGPKAPEALNHLELDPETILATKLGNTMQSLFELCTTNHFRQIIVSVAVFIPYKQYAGGGGTVRNNNKKCSEAL